MSVRTLLGGKVEVKTLGSMQPADPRPETRARILAPGGELAVLSEGSAPIRYLAYVELRAGTVRGNHFHKDRNERLYLLAGEAELFLQDMETGERGEVKLRPGDLASIPPNVAHAFLPGSNGHAVEFAAEAFEAADVYRIEALHRQA